jgi:hypothetical protein
MDFVFVTSASIVFLALYFLVWYLPFKEAYDHMMIYQSGTFFLNEKTLEYISFNLEHYFFYGSNTVYSIVLLISIATGFIYLFKTSSIWFKSSFIISLVWLVVELHKITMVYLPTRYQVSIFLAAGLIIALVVAEIINRGMSNIRIKPHMMITTSVMLFIMLVFNSIDYSAALNRRGYNIREANEYLANYHLEDDVVLGAWAPALTWKSKSMALPVWDQFLNYQDPIQTFHPRIIISETDEEDSNQAYLNQEIDLNHIADSTKIIRIGQWDIAIYWIH